jgi:hypothetical protein
MLKLTSTSENEQCFELKLKHEGKLSNQLNELIDLRIFALDGISVLFNFFINDSAESFSNLEGFELELNKIIGIIEDDDEITISIVGNKTNQENLLVCFPEVFFNESKSLISFWNQIYEDYSQISVWLENRLVTKKLIKNQELDTQSVYNNTDLIKNLNFTPEEAWSLKKEFSGNDIIESHFNSLTLTFCLSLMASHIDHEDRSKYIFEGYGRSEVIVNSNDNADLEDSVWVIYTTYQWAFSDNNISTKLGILRNILSLNTAEKASDVFNQNFLKILFSNYQIYLKDNINKYIEVKNKAISIINNLNEKLVENYYNFKKTSRASLIAVVSYFFTVIVIRFLSFKKVSTELIDFEIFSLTLVFSVAAIVYIYKQYVEVKTYKQMCLKRLESVNKQYEGILSDNERKETFSKALLIDCEEDDTNKTEYKLYILLLIGLNFLIFSLALFNLVTDV